MSKSATRTEKNTVLHFIVSGILFSVIIFSFSSCMNNQMQQYKNLLNQTEQHILNGEEVQNQDSLAKKALYLATGTNLTKTSNGAITASANGLCTATAIAPKIILTAAHCVRLQNSTHNARPDTLFIIVGVKPWKKQLDLSTWYGVDQVVVHPDYKISGGGTGQNDLALLRLTRPLPIDFVSELVKTKLLTNSFSLTMAGYGRRSNQKALPADQDFLGELFKTTKEISNYKQDSPTFEVAQQDAKGICYGDSGGPGLIFDKTYKQYRLLGIVSGFSWNVSEKKYKDPTDKTTCFGSAIYMNILYPPYYSWVIDTQKYLEKK